MSPPSPVVRPAEVMAILWPPAVFEYLLFWFSSARILNELPHRSVNQSDSMSRRDLSASLVERFKS